MMRRLIALIATCALVFAPLSAIGLDDNIADARRGGGGYSSGVKGFSPGSSQKSNTNLFRNNQQQQPQQNTNVRTNANNRTTANNPTAAQPNRGGFMQGLLYGGLAGLLFGSLFAGMGGLGAILGLLVNILAIYAIFMVIRKAFEFFKNKKADKDASAWRR